MASLGHMLISKLWSKIWAVPAGHAEGMCLSVKDECWGDSGLGSSPTELPCNGYFSSKGILLQEKKMGGGECMRCPL